MPAESFVMQTDGRILYDADKEEVGRMLFDDPMYKQFPQLLALGTLISREKKGAGTYEFKQEGSDKVVKKDAHWTTIGLYGTEWRLVVMHVRAGYALSSDENTEERSTASYREALRALAMNFEMKTALSENNSQKSGIYSQTFIRNKKGFILSSGSTAKERTAMDIRRKTV